MGVVKEIGSGMERKKAFYTKWLECVDEDEKRRLKDIYLYKMTKTKAKLAITSSKTTTFERLCAELGENVG